MYLKKQNICIPGPDRVDGKWGGGGEEGPGVEGRGRRVVGRILTFVLYTGDFCGPLISL